MQRTPSHTCEHYTLDSPRFKRYTVHSRRSSRVSTPHRIARRIAFALFVASILGAAGLVAAGAVTGLLAISRTDGSERILAGAAIVAATYLCSLVGLMRSGR